MAKTKKYLGVVLVLVLVLGLASAGVAMAQDNPTRPQTSLKQLYLEKLAANLGVEVNQLQDAMQKAGQQALDEAVSSGLLDSTRASRLEKALAAGRLPFLDAPGHRHKDLVHHLGGAVAGALGITPQELQKELKGGKTLEQVATEKGVTLEQLKEKLTVTIKGKLDQAVASGKLSQDKANQILERWQQLDLSKVGQLPRSSIR